MFSRFERLVFGMLTAEDRRTITALLEATGKSDCDWSADYRVFSRDAWEPTEVFARLIPHVIALHPDPHSAIIAALDDTNVRKTGTHIPGVAYRRDPMSPPFRANLIRAQRFVQTSIVVPFAPHAAAARAIPVAFDHAPSAGKLPNNATEEQKREHRDRETTLNLSSRALEAMRRLRNTLDQARPLLFSVDGSYTNGAVIKNLPPGTDLIGRVRKDAVLSRLPERAEGPGRPRIYGLPLTPEQVRQDDSLPWISLPIYAAGREHQCDVKELAPLLWRSSGRDVRLRLIVIRPLAYRKSKHSRLLYRQPAYLISTDLTTPLQQLVQAYFWRWDIEVNHRDEKQLIGLGHAQVRSTRSAERVPAFAVACYAILLISAARCFGLAASDPVIALPKWLSGSTRKPTRLSTRQILRRLRSEHRIAPVHPPNFYDFASAVARHMKLPKHAVSIHQALDFATN